MQKNMQRLENQLNKQSDVQLKKIQTLQSQNKTYKEQISGFTQQIASFKREIDDLNRALKQSEHARFGGLKTSVKENRQTVRKPRPNTPVDSRPKSQMASHRTTERRQENLR